ncbi:ATP-grasp domain-containing protein [Tamlana sp. 2_MG-2023]|uniref:ATP-grasp domain-containing protein n=1 Tax=unclassified Tamlana TaxID=2614803 RepID=UPI0026E2F538|nr:MULTISPECIES: ATP-grasp domain-containing protein [unclassified Tamlana]MDO6759409.1 ATP-grasp domain-containing protein [Tamlana sp. 2_MG-2023]MDO6790452.1 ATP-grasp domain-containing protein [Tamlana sp. 1_MG-2023]
MNILVTSAGKRVSLVRAFQKELKALTPIGKVFAADCNIQLSAACHVADEAFRLPRVDEKTFLNELLKVCLSNNVKLIIPTIDTELKILAEHSELLAENGIITIVSSIDFIKICRDKRKMSAFFTTHGIDIAKEYSKTDYELPLFIKPLNGSRSVDTFVILKEEDLTDYHFNKENLMFLEYLDHSEYEEFTCDLYYNKNSTLKCVVPRKRIEVRDGEVNKGITDKNVLVEYIKTHLNTIEGVKGCLTAQFFKHKKTHKIYGIEINARFGGGFPLSYLAGANYAKWIIEEYLFNKPVENYDGWEDKLLMLRYDNEVLVRNYNE